MTGNTLHLCNLDSVTQRENYYSYISANDALLIYAQEIHIKQYKNIYNCKAIMTNDIYFFTVSNPDNIPAIDYPHWVKLTEEYTKTFTWK